VSQTEFTFWVEVDQVSGVFRPARPKRSRHFRKYTGRWQLRTASQAPLIVASRHWPGEATIPWDRHPIYHAVRDYFAGTRPFPLQAYGNVYIRYCHKCAQLGISPEEGVGTPYFHKVADPFEKKLIQTRDWLEKDGFIPQDRDNIKVAVGADGQLWQVDGGTHRLLVAQALGITPIVVDAIIVHADYLMPEGRTLGPPAVPVSECRTPGEAS
jgi:hypothetical protein